jgi:hypothetical protein
MARLVASIQVISPVAGVSYALPVAQVGYILMVAEVELDAEGRYRIVIDSAVTTDGLHYQLAKGLRDGFAPMDEASQAVSKEVSVAQNAAVMQDQLNRNVQRAVADVFGLNDGAGINDGLDFASYKAIANVFFPNDLASLRSSKSQSDSQSFSDKTTRSASKGLADAQSMLDSFNRVVQYLRTYQDSSTALDDKAWVLSKSLTNSFGNLDIAKLQTLKATLDAFALSDAQQRSTSKGLSDPQVMADVYSYQLSPSKSDAFSTTDSKQYSWIKNLTDAFALNDATLVGRSQSLAVSSVNNVVFPTDVKSYGFAKGLVDGPIFNDVGELVLLTYCEAGYVQADYVGASRSF